MYGASNELELQKEMKHKESCVEYSFKSHTMPGDTIITYHFSKLQKLDIIQHKQCLFFFYFIPFLLQSPIYHQYYASERQHDSGTISFRSKTETRARLEILNVDASDIEFQ